MANQNESKQLSNAEKTALRTKLESEAATAENSTDESEKEASPVDPALLSTTLPLDEIVTEVMQGKWGRGQDRRLRLAEAGYDHVEVQKAVVRRANKIK